MSNKFQNIFSQLQAFEEHIGHLQGRILELEQRIEQLIQVERNHLIRVKNNEEVSDDFLYHGRRYQDLTPEKAWKFYNNKDFDFIVVDVSARDFVAVKKIPEALHIPWDEFATRFMEISSKTTPIFFISEDGANSILACEFMVKRGFFNCNNISGGYKYWKGNTLEVVKEHTA